MQGNRVHVVHFSTVHPADDTRIFAKECVSLAEAGFRVTLIAQGDGTTIIRDGVTCRSLRVPNGRALRMTVGQFRMLGILLWCRADIFHFHDPELLPTGLMLRLIGRRVVFDSHEHISKDLAEKTWLSPRGQRLAGALGRAIEHVADRFMSGVVVTTPGMRQAYPSGRTVLLRNLPKRAEFPKLPGWEERRRIGCYVGLVSEFRGSRQIARLAAHTSAKVVVAGRLPQCELGKLSGESGWRLIDYRGVLDRRAVVSLLCEAQVGLAILLPMKNFDDSIPTKLLEYLAAGVPVVASDIASWRALTEGFDCVNFVDPLDDQAVAAAVNGLLDDPERARAMGRAGRELVLQRFAWEREFEALLGLYASLLKPARASAREALS